MSDDLMCLVYVSVATAPMGEPELLHLLRQSRDNNARDGITGMLLYKDGRFMQLIEGPRPAIQGLYRKLVADDRHRDVTTLIKFALETRAFAGWSMGFAQPGMIPEGDRGAFTDFLERELSADTFRDAPHQATRMLLGFATQPRYAEG